MLVVGVHVRDAYEEVYAAPAARHRGGLLGEHEFQMPAAQGRHRRRGFKRQLLHLEAKFLLIEVNGVGQIVDFEKQQIETVQHGAIIYSVVSTRYSP